ncbi:NAD(P)H-dependent oxidoreductase [Patescibacteria group bacterium]|nr:NAD(P)H-dependent oxidoreductase [Patescibacteria group bacterium]
MNIVAISGSLRKGSHNAMLIHVLQELAPAEMKIQELNIGNLPLYNTDDEAAFPAEAKALKDAIEASDGVIIATPEYNRSFPGVLKNAIDWASRPWGKNSFAKKPALIMGVSIGKIGTAVAQSHLKEVLLYLDMRVIGQPELYLGPASGIFDEAGNLTDSAVRELLAKALAALASSAA